MFTKLLSTGMLDLLLTLFILTGLLVMQGMLNKQALRAWICSAPINPVYRRLQYLLDRSIEAGRQVHLALGNAGLSGLEGAASLAGLGVSAILLRRTARADHPALLTAGEGALAALGEAVAKNVSHQTEQMPCNLPGCHMCGLTSFSYAAGVMMLIDEQPLEASLLVGGFGLEAMLIVEAGERHGTFSLAGSLDLPTQSAMYTSADESLLGDQIFYTSVALEPVGMHAVNRRFGQILRGLLIFILMLSAGLKMAGIW